MIFPNYNYKEYNLDNKEVWPDSWENMLFNCHKYCTSLPLNNILEFEGKCNPIYLPSEHPYWMLYVSKQRHNSRIIHLDNYNKCVQKPSLIKFFYNISTSLEDIKRKLDLLEIQANLNVQCCLFYGKDRIDAIT